MMVAFRRRPCHEGNCGMAVTFAYYRSRLMKELDQAAFIRNRNLFSSRSPILLMFNMLP